MLEVEARSELGELAEAWDALLDRQSHPTPHLRSWWLHAGAKGRPLFVLTMDGGRVVGGLALELHPLGGIPRAKVMASGSWPSGFDLLAEPGRDSEVLETLSGWIRSSRIRIFDLTGVLGEARVVSVLPGTVRSQESGTAWVIDLPSEFQQYLATRSREFRRDLTRAQRRVAEAELAARQVPDTQVERALATLEDLHIRQYPDQSTFRPFFHSFADAAREGVRDGEVLFHELADTSGRTLEIQVWLRVGDSAWGLVGGRDPDAVRGSGTVMRAWAIEQFCDQGLGRVDLGGGYGHWKQSWATDRRTQLHVVAANGSLARLALAAGDSTLRSKRAVARWILETRTRRTRDS